VGRPLRGGAVALALLVIGAIVGTQTSSWFPLLGIAAGVWAFGFLIDQRWLQERASFIRPPDARFRQLSAAGRALRAELGELHLSLNSDRTLTVDRDPWNTRLQNWDDDYWGFVRRYYYSREPTLRGGAWDVENAVGYEGDHYNWCDGAIGYLNYRLRVLDELLPDLPS
jgi:hypothetical protein